MLAITDPFQLPSGLTLPNRLAKAAMTERLAGFDGLPNDDHIRLYRRFADGGAGLIITGNAVIDARFLEAPGNLILEDSAAVPAFAKLSEAIKQRGALAILQLNHAGRQTPRSVSEEALAPSAVSLMIGKGKYFSTAKEMSGADVADVIDRFVRAAELAQQAGFDGVQVHAAHGYLLNQFLSPRTNLRNDRWGGSVTNRASIVCEIVRRIRLVTGNRFSVSVKLNAGDFIKGGLSSADALAMGKMIGSSGIDFLEISGGTHEYPVVFDSASSDQEAIFGDFAERLRAISEIPLMLTGRIRSVSRIEELLNNRTCDFVGMARPLATNPDLPNQMLTGQVAAAPSIPLKLPPPPRGPLAELSWAGLQLRRMARGADPKLTMSPTLAMIRLAWSGRGWGKRRDQALGRS